MPTAFTAGLCEREVPFKEFVLKCARGMSMLISMRDDPLDDPIPQEFKPSDYHLENYESDLAELEKLTGMTDAEAEDHAMKEYQRQIVYHDDAKSKTAAIRARLVAMRTKVAAWPPPTSEHENFKKFMLEQLYETIKRDGSYDLSKPKRKSGKAWKKDNLDRLKKDVVYHKEEYTKEVERARERTQWVADLRASLQT